VLKSAFPDRTVFSPVLPELATQGRLGQKTGAGFFKYKDRTAKGEPDPKLEAILRPLMRGGPKLSRQQIIERLFLPMLLEATRVVEERIVRDPRDVDLGLIYGIGFPPFRGGLLFWADTVGAAKVLEMLKPWESLGPRFAPTPLLIDMARTGKRFYIMEG
jgi:3-hydroxyacyl-CoA dehydrogenase/enoyl-CoA hydratase/3-hydroxybutyryl-CoA epimerase/3-hydroxyacyl-CoA dehydrogenase/enoyl-CoA hydratase/3-hydroxybutyryl-CoA epimerase/enoyl-CoA isomerase